MLINLQSGFISNAANITYLVVGIVLSVVSLFLIGLSYWTARNKPDHNRLEMHNWFMKWIIKNRMMFCMCITVIIILFAIAMILMAFGINFVPTPDTN